MTAPVVLCPGGRIPESLATAWAAAALAEVTHAPTGASGLGTGVATLAPGARGGWQHYPAEAALVVVLGGELAIDWGAATGQCVVAGPGDAIAIAAGTAHRERHTGGSGPVRYARLAPGGPPVPAPAPPG